MGSGFRTFATGEVLTSSNVQGYLMKQAVMSFANAGARDAAITAPEEGMVAVLRDIDAVSIHNGSGWVTYGSYGTWTTYTPSWTAATTNPSLGNGVRFGRYTVMGKTVHFVAQIIMGSSTSYGSGGWRVGLPPITPRETELRHPIHVRAFDVSSGQAYMGQGVTATSFVTPTVQGTDNLDTVQAGTPIAWAATDELTIFGTYEAL